MQKFNDTPHKVYKESTPQPRYPLLHMTHFFVLCISPTNFVFSDFPTQDHYYQQEYINLSHFIAIIS